MTTRARQARRERAARRRRMRVALVYVAAMIAGAAAGFGIDGWVQR